jgi:hypothetical protein
MFHWYLFLLFRISRKGIWKVPVITNPVPSWEFPLVLNTWLEALFDPLEDASLLEFEEFFPKRFYFCQEKYKFLVVVGI